LMSRSTLWRLNPLREVDISRLCQRGARLRDTEVTEEALAAITSSADGDARAALTTLDTAIVLARRGDLAAPTVTLEHVSQARDGRLYHQSRDTHYDQVSAFIKSVRGSDPDAALYWLVTLLESGESARFLARRLVILASEDVGLADPMGIVVAESCARAVEFVGLPEARLTLAHATLALALAAKSNSVTRALGAATSAVQAGGTHEVPAHLRDAHYAGAANLGFGAGYAYPHEYPHGWVRQEYLPDALVGSAFYEPSEHGRELDTVTAWRARTEQPSWGREAPPVE
nr:replication-associated recombination protein A [Acidobacteriota bacterium]